MMRTVVVYGSKELNACIIVPRKFSKDNLVYDDLVNSIFINLDELPKDFGHWIKKTIREFDKTDMLFKEISLQINESIDSFFKTAKVLSYDEFNKKYKTALTVLKENKSYIIGLSYSDRPELPKRQVSENCKDNDLKDVVIEMILQDFQNYT